MVRNIIEIKVFNRQLNFNRLNLSECCSLPNWRRMENEFFFVNKVHILTECCENVLFWIHSLTRICFTDFWRKMYSTGWHAVIWTLLEKFCKLDEFNQCLMCYLFIYFLCTICVHLYNSISPKYAQNISWSNALIR